jgi:hypothetical protein
VTLAKTNPGAAIRKLVLVEKLVQEGIAKGGLKSIQQRRAPDVTRVESFYLPKNNQCASATTGDERPQLAAPRRIGDRLEGERFRALSGSRESQGNRPPQRTVIDGNQHVCKHQLGEHGGPPTPAQQIGVRRIFQQVVGKRLPQGVRHGLHDPSQISPTHADHGRYGYAPAGHFQNLDSDRPGSVDPVRI